MLSFRENGGEKKPEYSREIYKRKKYSKSEERDGARKGKGGPELERNGREKEKRKKVREKKQYETEKETVKKREI